MKKIKINWIEDKKPFVIGLLKRMEFYFQDLSITPKNGELSYIDYLNTKDVWIFKNEKIEINIEHNNYVYDIQLMAKWANDAETSIFFIDYNLKDHNGLGINGDELIKEIRKHSICKIIFYSSESSQDGLRNKIGNLENVDCMAREHLFDYLSTNLEDYF